MASRLSRSGDERLVKPRCATRNSGNAVRAAVRRGEEKCSTMMGQAAARTNQREHGARASSGSAPIVACHTGLRPAQPFGIDLASMGDAPFAYRRLARWQPSTVRQSCPGQKPDGRSPARRSRIPIEPYQGGRCRAVLFGHLAAPTGCFGEAAMAEDLCDLAPKPVVVIVDDDPAVRNS